MTVEPAADSAPAALRLGFARGTAPSKWAERYAAAAPGRTLELVPHRATFGRRPSDEPVDVTLERAMPGDAPEGAGGERHAIRLYIEAVALVVPRDHELAESDTIDVADLELVALLDHPGHSPSWVDPEPWADPSFRPATIAAALDLVATGLGGMLLPRPLARHLVSKRDHAIVALTGDSLPEGTGVWATWDAERDDAEIQQLIGVLRGRTARSSRSGDSGADGGRGARSAAPSSPSKTASKAKSTVKLNPNSRGAQLAAAREKALAKKRKRKR